MTNVLRDKAQRYATNFRTDPNLTQREIARLAFRDGYRAYQRDDAETTRRLKVELQIKTQFIIENGLAEVFQEHVSKLDAKTPTTEP